MREKKLQVFVSSTYTDLIEERQAAVEAILASGNIPAGMELFSAGDESQMTVIERWIDESDVYLLILGGRYGSIDKNTDKSYTHLEYEYALKQGKPLFAVVISNEALDNKVKRDGTKAIEQDRTDLLKSFRETVTSNLVKFWEDKKDIKLAIYDTLGEFSHRKELVGWIRGDKAVNAGPLAEEIVRLTKENSELRSQLMTVSNGSAATYNGLTYQQLERLLMNEKINYDDLNTVFQYLMIYGNALTRVVYNPDYKTIAVFEKLMLFKMLIKPSFNTYQFSSEGHNFYLQMLTMRDS